MSSGKSRMKDRECALEDCFANRIRGDGVGVCMILKSAYANYEICPFYKSKTKVSDRYVEFCKQADKESYEYAEDRIGKLTDTVKAKESTIRILKEELEKDRGKLLCAKKAKERMREAIEREKRKNGLNP